MKQELRIQKDALKRLNQNHVNNTKLCPFDCKILRQVSVGIANTCKGRVSSCYSCYRVISAPVRVLFSMTVKACNIVKENILFPDILLTEGYQVLRNNFGFSRDKMWNNAVLGGMLSFSLANLWINPWLDEQHAEVDAVWYQVTNRSIPDEKYMVEFYSATLKFAAVLGLHVACELGNLICEFLLKTAITLKSQREFVLSWLADFSAYGLNANNVFSGTERDEEKANLNPVNIFQDIEHKGDFSISLINSRINTLIDCRTAFSMLAMLSPSIDLGEVFGFQIMVPQLIVYSFVYSMLVNIALMLFEKRMDYCYERMQHYKDKLVRQIINNDVNGELISFVDGAKFEAEKLLGLLNKEYDNARQYEGLNALRQAFEIAIKHFQWLVPIYAIIPLVRSGVQSQEMVGPITENFIRVSLCLMWAKHNIQNIQKLMISVTRWDLFQERMKAWKTNREEIEKKMIDSDEISFKGTIYLDKDKKVVIGAGKIDLPQGSITHFDAPSGSGKTTVFRCLCGLHDFSGKITLPRNHTAFLPSLPYILRIQDIIESKEDPGIIEYVKLVFKTLNMPDRVTDSLMKLLESKNKDVNDLNTANWMGSLSDGERKRVAFALLLVRLRTEELRFVSMDEPFKGIDLPTQKIMVALLREAIADGPSAGCTILFSNHEQNHGLNTHVLTIDKDTKAFQFQAVKSSNKNKEEIGINVGQTDQPNRRKKQKKRG